MSSNSLKHGSKVIISKSHIQNQQRLHYDLTLTTDDFLCRGSHYIA